MTLSRKAAVGALGAVTITVVIALVVQRAAIRQEGIDGAIANMRSTLIEAESVRESISLLQRRRAFDQARLGTELRADLRGAADLRRSTLYATVPVVAAWNAIERVAKQEGYKFRIPKRQARNPENQPRPDEEEILHQLEDRGQAEYIQVDEGRNEIVYARPIRLSQDCLACHGDPATSPTKDGRDITGMPMEGWKTGQVHGAFVFRTASGPL